jgi:hypothetical protein
LSKKQQKKLAKLEKKFEKRKVKRVEERQRRKENRKALRESGQNELLKKPKFTEMSLSKCPINVVVDM